MKPTMPDQIVKFEKPYDSNEAQSVFQIKEIFFDVEKPRAIVISLNQGGYLASTHSYLVEDLIVMKNEC